VVEFLSRGGIHSTLAILAVALTWAASIARILWINRDYRSAQAGGWLVLGGVMAVTLSAATMVPPHTSVLMTVYAGLGPPLMLIMGMAGLLIIDGMGAWLNPPSSRSNRVARWGGMALILAGLGLLMELRGAIALHMGLSELSSQPVEVLARSTERWFMLARNSGVAATVFGFVLAAEGTVAGISEGEVEVEVEED
jgi:hypothetical protein